MKIKIITIAFVVLLIQILSANAQQKPELVVQKGHSTPVTSLAFSENGKILVSGESNGTVKMWNAATGENIRSLELYSELRDSFALNRFGRLLFTASVGECAFWDLQDGRKTYSFKRDDGENYFSERQFSFASSMLAVVTQDTFNLVDFKNQKEVKAEGVAGLVVHSIAFSPDGKTLAVANYSKADDASEAKQGTSETAKGFNINLYDAESGRLLRKIKNLAGAATKLAFSADGQFLAATGEAFGGGGKRYANLWNAASGESLSEYEAFDDDLEITLTTGAVVISTVNRELKVLRFDKGAFEAQIFADKTEVVSAAAFAPGGEFLATGDMTGVLKFWNLKDGRTARVFGADIRPASKIQIDRDSRQLFLAQKIYSYNKKNGVEYESEMKIFDFDSGVKANIFPKISNGIAVSDFAFGADGKTFAVSGKSEQESRVKSALVNLGAVLGQVETNKTIVLKSAPNEVFTSLAYSPDGKKIATGSTQQGWLPNGQLGSGSEDRAIKIWDAGSGKLLRRIAPEPMGAGGAENVYVAFSPDGITLTSVSRDETVRIFDVATGKQIKKIDRNSDDLAKFYNFSPDGKTIAFQSFGADEERRKIKILNVADGSIAHTFAGHTGETSAAAFTADGKILISTSDDGTIKFWNVETEKEMASLIFIGADDWIATTPEGLFDGTPAAWKSLLWRFDNNPFNTAPIEAFFNDFYYPNLIQEIIAGKPPAAPRRNLADIDIRQPTVAITAVDGKTPSDKTTASAAKVKVKIEVTHNTEKPLRANFPATSGAQDLRLFRNGSLVKHWDSDVSLHEEANGCRQIAVVKDAPRKFVCEVEVQITAGENKFSAYVFNHDNVKSADAVADVRGADSLRRDGTLYILAVGVNRYADASRNLKFAVADVDAAAEEIAAAQNKLAKKQYAKTEIIRLTDERATQENIMLALERFTENRAAENAKLAPDAKTELDKIKFARPEDAIIIYYAGHGTASKDAFYLIPHDGFPASGAGENYYAELYTRSVSNDILEALLETVDAGRILMVIDACNSGQALEAEEKRRGPMNSRGLAQLAFEKGMYILTAAQSYQAALEVTRSATGKRIEHGLLTYSLLEGLTTAKADGNSNREVTEREWLNYAVEAVPRMQIEEMKTRSAGNGKRSDIVFLDGDDPKADPNKRAVQTPRIFYRREAAPRPLTIAKIP